MNFQGSFQVDANADHVYQTFTDVKKLTHCIPGVENVQLTGRDEYEADMTVKIQFMTIQFRVEGQLEKDEQEKIIQGTLHGKPNKLAGVFQNHITIQVHETKSSTTKIDYQMKVNMSGRLASLGTILVKSTINKTAKELIENVQNYFSQEKSVSESNDQL